jgi:uncharacterized protein (TIGR02246 family)
MTAHSPGELHTLFRNSFNVGDIDALVLLYEPDAVLIVGGMQVEGHDGIRAAISSMIAAGGRMSLTTRTVMTASDGVALIHGEWVIERTATETTRGISTEVVRKQPDGSWRFVIDNPYTPVVSAD